MKVSVLFNRRKEKEMGTVDVQVYIDRKQRKYISTGVRVRLDQWDPVAQRVKNHRTKENLNLQISNLLDNINRWHRECLMNQRRVTIEGLMLFLNKPTHHFSLNDYFTQQLALDKGTIRTSTYKKREYAVNRFAEFGIFMPGDLGVDDIHRYHQWMLGKGLKPVSTRNYHKIIDLYLKRAERAGFIKENPYRDYKKPPATRSITFLTPEEVQKIREYNGIQRLEKIRDLFLFQCLTGMAYSDMQALRWEDITNGERPYVIKPRTKSDVVPQMVPLLPEAREILDRFNGENYCFPRISNQKLNAYLQEIANIKGISKKLTTHVGRHTFATVMLEKGLPLETISHILGHASTDTTRVYARILMSKINNDLSRLNIEGI